MEGEEAKSGRGSPMRRRRRARQRRAAKAASGGHYFSPIDDAAATAHDDDDDAAAADLSFYCHLSRPTPMGTGDQCNNNWQMMAGNGINY